MQQPEFYLQVQCAQRNIELDRSALHSSFHSHVWMFQPKDSCHNISVPTNSLDIDHLLVADALANHCKFDKKNYINELFKNQCFFFVMKEKYFLLKCMLLYSRNINTSKNLLNSVANHFMFDIVQHSYTKQNPKMAQHQMKITENKIITNKK